MSACIARSMSIANPSTSLVALMLGTLRMSVNEAIDALLDITAAIFPDNPEDAIDLDINAKNLKDAIENMLEARNIVLETKMDETRASAGCKVYVASIIPCR